MPLPSAVKIKPEFDFRRGRYPLAIATGVLLALAFPNFNVAGLAWVAPALMLFAAREQSGGDAFRTGYLSGLAFWLTSLVWLLRIPVTGFPILGWIALAAYLALYSGAWVWLISRPERISIHRENWYSRTMWALGGAAAWVALEIIRSRLFGGFPWNLIGSSQFKLVPLIQISALTGVYGVSFLIVWFSLALLSAGEMVFRHPTKKHVWQAEIALPLVATMGCFIGGFFQLQGDAPVQKVLRICLIQPSVPQSLIWSAAADQKRFGALLDLSQRSLTSETDLLVWPESAVPALDQSTYERIVRFAQSNHIWMIFNGDDVEMHPDQTNYFNAALLMNPEGRIENIYHKRQLVIFGEYVPLARWLPFLKWFTPIEGGWTAGDLPGQFAITRTGQERREPVIEFSRNTPGNLQRREVRISPLICFEDVFPGTARQTSNNTDFLVNLTNDGWFGDGAAQWQHAANAVFRAVENGMALIRCANNGVTCWIDSYGRLREIFADANGNVHGTGTLTMDLTLPAAEHQQESTFYHRYGDWFAWSCCAITLGQLIRYRFGRKTKPGKTPEIFAN